MIRLAVLLIHVAAIVSTSLQACPEEAKQAIEAARNDVEMRLIETGPSFPIRGAWIPGKKSWDDPHEQLRDLEKRGKECVDMIVSHTGPGDKDKAIDYCISFWKKYMEQIINPYYDAKNIFL